MSFKSKISTIGFSFLFVSVLIACQKKDETKPEPAKANIIISSPKASYQYKHGDTVHINASVTYISQMHGYNVRITDKNTNMLVGDIEGHVHGDHFEIAEKWVDTISGSTTLKIELIAIIDHDNNKATAEVEIQSQP